MAHERRPDAPQPPGLAAALVPVATLVGLLGLAFYLFGDAAAAGPNQIALIFCALVAMLVAWRRGHSVADLRDAAMASVSTGLTAIFILLAVGALIGTWAMSGTLVAMVYYGLQLLNPDYFYMTSCLICAVIAVSIGSSWTVAGTVGIGLMGIAAKMGLDPAITAGAIISGAYFGDKASPLSDTANLACAAAGRTSTTTSASCSGPRSRRSSSRWRSSGASAPPWPSTLRPPSPASRRPSTRASCTSRRLSWSSPSRCCAGPPSSPSSSARSPAASSPSRPPPTASWPSPTPTASPAALRSSRASGPRSPTGFVSATGEPAVDALLTRGGMASMLGTVWLILTALAFGGIVERAGILDRLIGPLIAAARSTGALVATLVGSAFATNVLASDQYIAIVLPGRMFRTAFDRRGLAPVVLSRAIGDSATVTSPLVPWNSCGAYLAATLGVAATAFAPFCFFNLLNPLITIAFAGLGLRMHQARSDDPTGSK